MVLIIWDDTGKAIERFIMKRIFLVVATERFCCRFIQRLVLLVEKFSVPDGNSPF